MKGRNKIPTEIKKMKGTYRSHRELQTEMKTRELTFEEKRPPESLNEFGKSEWTRVIAMFENHGILTESDHTMLFSMCNEWGKYMEAEEFLKKNGRTMKTPNGYLAVHPIEQIGGQAWKRYKEMAIQFGLTPAARTRVAAREKQGENPSSLLKAI